MSGNGGAGGDGYARFLDAQDVATLRDWALRVARERLDVGFVWDLVKHLPDSAESYEDFSLLDPIDAIRELVHLVTHFREEAADPAVADLLRARYIDYLVDHADHHRFDRA